MLRLYTRRNLLVGLLVYGIGDALAALLSGHVSVSRLLGMMLVGALVYGAEIPHYFGWVERTTRGLSSGNRLLVRTALALLYFNPLWVARHLLFIALFGSGTVDCHLLTLAWQSFVRALPLTICANVIIQNVISLPHRFLASALFSGFMAVCYPLLAAWLDRPTVLELDNTVTS